jgi:hypothetical protein
VFANEEMRRVPPAFPASLKLGEEDSPNSLSLSFSLSLSLSNYLYQTRIESLELFYVPVPELEMAEAYRELAGLVGTVFYLAIFIELGSDRGGSSIRPSSGTGATRDIQGTG